MNLYDTVTFALGVAFGAILTFLIINPAHGQTVLQDSATSSANPKGNDTTGKPTPAMQGPFNIHCYDTTSFAANIKKKEAIVIMTGFDAEDSSLILTFKFKDGSLAMARTNKEGTMTCQYGTVLEPQFDIRTVLKGMGLGQ